MPCNSLLPAIHIFNPETDLALACGRESYTPPARILALRRRLSTLPALWAKDGDVIAIDDELPVSDLLHTGKSAESVIDFRLPPHPTEDELIHASRLAIFDKRLQIVNISQIRNISGTISPWGWNASLCHKLLISGVSPNRVPNEYELNTIRALAHRRTTIDFHKAFRLRGLDEVEVPIEAKNMDEVIRAISMFGSSCYLKSPWSSSGRGIYHLDATSDSTQISSSKVWAHGSIGRQGSVMVEKAEHRILDFASEWDVDARESHFTGWSVFQTSRRGGYSGNVWADPHTIENLILTHIPDTDLERIVSIQRECLNELIAPHYSGSLGIDMLATPEGRVNPCVEINIRMTMGRAALEWANQQEYHNDKM